MFVAASHPICSRVRSPDGKWIAWRAELAARPQLWVMKSDGSSPQLLYLVDKGVDIGATFWAAGPP
jgi:Tol biopolymer transport system component